MKINEILKSKGHEVASINLRENVSAALAVFAEKRIGSLVVMDDENNISGIFTERDIIRFFTDIQHSPEKPVSDYMTPASKLCIATPDDSVQYAMSIMTNQRIKHIPIIKNNKLFGLISIGDVVKSLLEQSKSETKRLQDYIAGTYPAE